MSEEEKIISDMLHIILKYSDGFDELEENEIRYQLPYKQMEKLYNYIFDLQKELQQKENIIKEVREYIENAFATGEEIFKVEILEILDKGE